MDLTSRVENEYLCLKILNALGLPAANAEIETFGERRVLIVERFDRLWTADHRLLRLPQEDSCQALSVPPTLKYESDGGPGITDILKMLRGSDEPLSDQRSFLKANIAFWLMGATDGHAKNFSIFLSPGGPRHFFQTADRAGVGQEVIESVIHELVEGGIAAVDSVVSKLPKNFPDQIASSIEAGIKGRLRLLAAPETPSSQK